MPHDDDYPNGEKHRDGRTAHPFIRGGSKDAPAPSTMGEGKKALRGGLGSKAAKDLIGDPFADK